MELRYTNEELAIQRYSDHLLAAGRPGAASLILAVTGLIVSGLTPDRELLDLAGTLAKAGLKQAIEAKK